jgi:hypothetical protein
MRFRPEAIHGASGETRIFHPFPERHGDVSHKTRRVLLIQDLTILKYDLEGFTAIETGETDGYFLAREKPADRQRFKGSLAEPFLLPLDGDAVLGGEIVKRGEGDDLVGSGGKPAGYS